jgi:alpha-amylase
LHKLRFLDIGSHHDCFDTARERRTIARLAEECYLPVNRLLLQLLSENPAMQLTFSISGVMIEQLEAYAPGVLKTFRTLADTGSVEFLSETYYHSLAFVLPGREFENQVLMHAEKLQEHFGVRPSAFRNTGMPFNEEIAQRVSAMGYAGIIVDGDEPILNGWSPHYIYEHSKHDYLRVVVNNARFTNTLHSRLVGRGSHAAPADSLFSFDPPPDQAEVMIFSVDYASLGRASAAPKGSLRTLEHLVRSLGNSKKAELATASAAMISRKVHGDLSRPTVVSQTEEPDHASQWLGNEMQQEAFDLLLSLEPYVHSSNDETSLKKWRTLQASEYFSYMCTDMADSGQFKAQSGQYATPYEAFINFMNVACELLEYLRILEFRDGTTIARLNQTNFLENAAD